MTQHFGGSKMAKRVGKYKISKKESALSIIDGGDIQGDLTVEGVLSLGGNLTLDSSGGKVHITDNCEIDGNCDIDGQLDVKNSTNSSSKTTGALVVAGGVGINNDLFVGGDITAFASSDERLKDNIRSIEDPLAKVLSIRGVTYTWKDGATHSGDDIGVIAQELELLNLPGMTQTRPDGYKAVRYERLTALLVEAVKELSGKVSELEAKLNQ